MVSDRIMAPSSVFTTKQISILKSAKSLGIIRHKTQYPKVKSSEQKLSNGVSNLKPPPKTSPSSLMDQSKPGLISNMSTKAHSSDSSTKLKITQILPTKDQDPLNNNVAKKDTKTKLSDQIKTFLCKYCCRKFPNGDLLDAHQKSHGPNPVHACHICGIAASTFSSLMAHYVRHSSGKLSDSQKKWTKAYLNQGTIVKIPSRVESGISCAQCKRIFNKKEAFNSHYCPAVNKKTEFVCTYCRKITTTVEEYRDHIQSHSLPQFICPSCGVQYAKKSQLNEHINVCSKKKLKIGKKNCNSTPPKNKKRTKLVKTPEDLKKTKASPKSTKSLSETAVVNNELPLEDNKLVQNSTENLDAVQNAEIKDSSLLNDEQNESALGEKSIKKRRRRKRKSKELLDSFEAEESEPVYKRPLRTARSQPRYVADLNSTYQPTRRSARLTGRKKISFSDDGDISENEMSLEVDMKEENELQFNAVDENQPSFKNEVSNETEIHKEETEVKPEISENTVGENLSEEIKNDSENEKVVVITKSGKVIRRRKPKLQAKPTALYCQVCSLLFRSLGSLRRHKKMHTGKPQFVCQFCGKFFFRRDIHLRHENSVHQNSAEKGFLCYYCKDKFESSQQLKDHSTEAHVAKALTPERIRRCTGVSKNRKNFKSTAHAKKIKAEPAEEKHRPVNDSVTEDCKTNNLFLGEVSELDDTIFDRQKLTDTKLLISKRTGTSKENVLNTTDNSESATESSFPKDSSTFKSSQNISESDLDINVEIKDEVPSLEIYDSYPKCYLCSKELPEDESACCRDVAHKAVEWFQCLVCAYSGTQLQIQEHMLSHTYKVGTVVVREDDENCNHIRTYLPLFADVLEVPEDYQENEEICNDEPIADKDCNDDSSTTLMKSVTCKKCQEVIVDIEFLIHHSCIESEDSYTFSCFVENCRYITDNKSNLQCHLGRKHYTSLLASAFTTQKGKTAHKKFTEPEPFFECDSQIENIFLDMSTNDDAQLLTELSV